MSFTLRDYQQKSVSDIRDAYQNGYQAPLLVLRTGGGKTIIFSYIAHNSASRGKRVLILVHRIELLRQTINKLREFGVRVGAISPKYSPDYTAPVQVAMVQTVTKRLMYYPKFDLIITDECHRSIYNVWRQVLEYFDAFLIGLTATPSLQTFGFFNQNLVMEYPHERAVADGVNVGYEVYRIRTQITEQGSTIQSGFYVDTRNRQTRAVR
jgi:type I site-specific restriction endonuclease